MQPQPQPLHVVSFPLLLFLLQVQSIFSVHSWTAAFNVHTHSLPKDNVVWLGDHDSSANIISAHFEFAFAHEDYADEYMLPDTNAIFFCLAHCDGAHITACTPLSNNIHYPLSFLSNIGLGHHRISSWLARSADGNHRMFPFNTLELALDIVDGKSQNKLHRSSTSISLISPRTGTTFGKGSVRVISKIQNWPLKGKYCIRITRVCAGSIEKGNGMIMEKDTDTCKNKNINNNGQTTVNQCFRHTIHQTVDGLTTGSYDVQVSVFDASGILVSTSESGVGRFHILNETLVTENYHMWYADHVGAIGSNRHPLWKGVVVQKSVLDLWVISEILYEIQPTLVIEFGTLNGGSALWFSDNLRTMLEATNNTINDKLQNYRVLTVDVNLKRVHAKIRDDPHIEMIEASSISDIVRNRVKELIGEHSRVFVTLDSKHTMAHVLTEMEMIAPLLNTGDYMIVEDTHHNGHPIAWTDDFGPGPYEAVEEFDRKYPQVFFHDTLREKKFGFTWNPRGFLIKQ